jgi:hypothetical protein
MPSRLIARVIDVSNTPACANETAGGVVAEAAGQIARVEAVLVDGQGAIRVRYDAVFVRRAI